MTKVNEPNLPHCCDIMKERFHAEELPLIYIPKFREFGLRVMDGGTSFVQIFFCPWCGTKLPAGLRELWFIELKKLGLAIGSSNIPESFNSDEWWRKRGL